MACADSFNICLDFECSIKIIFNHVIPIPSMAYRMSDYLDLTHIPILAELRLKINLKSAQESYKKLVKKLHEYIPKKILLIA